VRLNQARPIVATDDFHSLAELAVQSADGRQIVEVGWTVDPLVNGDGEPRLFVFHWVDAQPSCYNGCGFVEVSTRVRPGMRVAVGKASRYGIRLRGGKWWIYYRGRRVGYYPTALWSGAFTRAELVQAFGEVAVSGELPCTDMGDGTFGSFRGSARIAGFRLLGSQSRPPLTVVETAPSLYNSGGVRRSSFRFGGPGAC
jgi:hypothetical protein